MALQFSTTPQKPARHQQVLQLGRSQLRGCCRVSPPTAPSWPAMARVPMLTGRLNHCCQHRRLSFLAKPAWRWSSNLEASARLSHAWED